MYGSMKGDLKGSFRGNEIIAKQNDAVNDSLQVSAKFGMTQYSTLK